VPSSFLLLIHVLLSLIYISNPLFTQTLFSALQITCFASQRISQHCFKGWNIFFCTEARLKNLTRTQSPHLCNWWWLWRQHSVQLLFCIDPVINTLSFVCGRLRLPRTCPGLSAANKCPLAIAHTPPIFESRDENNSTRHTLVSSIVCSVWSRLTAGAPGVRRHYRVGRDGIGDHTHWSLSIRSHPPWFGHPNNTQEVPLALKMADYAETRLQ
jgi:hypothetical protein